LQSLLRVLLDVFGQIGMCFCAVHIAYVHLLMHICTAVMRGTKRRKERDRYQTNAHNQKDLGSEHLFPVLLVTDKGQANRD